MRVKHSKTSLARELINGPHGGYIQREFNIAITPHGRLRLKLLLFRNSRELMLFWKKGLNRDLGSIVKKDYKAQGVVSAMMYDVESYRNAGKVQKWAEVDPNYFAVMGLCLTDLSMEIITHESVHAAYAYEKRHRGQFWVNKDELDEEHIAYPAGRIAAAVNRVLYRNNLYQE